MAFKNCNKLLETLEQYQQDYYTKGKALKIHNALTDVLPKLNFRNDKDSLEFYECYKNLKKIESLTNINEYSEKFAHNLLRLMLIVNNSKISSEENYN